MGTVERTDVVQSEESAAEEIVAPGILTIEPPGEVQQQFLENPLEKIEISCSIDNEDPDSS